jgi:tetratricopeptide (TPR) repeat protein
MAMRKLAGMAAVVALSTPTLGCPRDPLAEARNLERDGRTDEAAESYLDAARADPALMAAWDGAARLACGDRADISGCLEVLDTELELLGQVERHGELLAEALERRGRARLAQGLVHAALEDLTRAQEVAPERPSIFAAQARAYLMQGRRVEAKERIEQARKRDPSLEELSELHELMNPSDSP